MSVPAGPAWVVCCYEVGSCCLVGGLDISLPEYISCALIYRRFLLSLIGLVTSQGFAKPVLEVR